MAVLCDTASFRIWNSSIGIPSPPLALFVVMLPKAHSTSHSRMSGSRLVVTPLWFSGLWRSFLYSSSVYSCYLFLISSASVRSLPFLSFIMLIFAWNVPLVSLIFLKRSLVFSILLFSSISSLYNQLSFFFFFKYFPLYFRYRRIEVFKKFYPSNYMAEFRLHKLWLRRLCC